MRRRVTAVTAGEVGGLAHGFVDGGGLRVRDRVAWSISMPGFAMRHLFSVLILSAAGCGLAVAETPAAPFGLSWGQSRAAVEAQGVTLTACRALGAVETCIASDLSTPFEDGGTYRVSFSETIGLDTIRFASNVVAPDRRGHEARAIYERVRTRIGAEHGEGRRREKMFQKPPYQMETQFYECLRQGARCGVWSSEWRGLGISMELRAVPISDGGGGYVDLVYYGPAEG